MLKDFSKEEFDIIIQAGQSNSQGCGLGEVDEPFEPSDNIWYLNSNFTISIAQEQVSGNRVVGNFSLNFANKYINNGNLQAGRKLLILRTAVGGTGFVDNRWGLNDDLYLRMVEMTKTALALNSKNKLITLLWHQGEREANNNISYDTHYNNLTTLINTVRHTFNCKHLPFAAGDFVIQWKSKNIKACEPIVQAMKDTCKNIGNARFIETDELKSNNQSTGVEDIIHFSRESLYELGRKYYNAFCEITRYEKMP